MSIYRKSAREDMIIELNEDEIKQACLEFIDNKWNVYSKNESPEDVTISVKAMPKDRFIITARIEGKDP